MRRLSYVNLLSKNNQKLIEFYTNVVGLTPQDGNGEKWYGFDTGSVPFAIEPLSNRDKYMFEYRKENPVLIQFEAESLEDLTKWTEDLEAKGVIIGQRIMQKSYGVVTTFTDPDGNVIELLFSK